MNKTLKVILIFVGVLALLYLAVKLETYLTVGSDQSESRKTVYQQMSQEIDRDWQSQDNWNKQLFEQQMATINAKYQQGILKKNNRSSLVVKVGETAWRVIDSVFNAEMASPNSNKTVVDANKKGLLFMRRYEDERDGKVFANNEHIAQSLAMYEDYKEALDFAGKSFVASASIDSLFRWTSFQTSRNSWDLDKRKIERGKYFNSHFSKINTVKNTWSNYESIMTRSQEKFNKDLSQNLPQKMTTELTSIKEQAAPAMRAAEAAISRLADLQKKDSNATSNALSEARTEVARAKTGVQEVYALVDEYCANADTAIQNYGSQVSSSNTAYSTITNLKNNASKLRTELRRLIDKM